MNEIKTNIKYKFIIENENKKEMKNLRYEKNYYFYDIVLNDIINIIYSFKINDLKILSNEFLKENIKIDNEKKEIKLIKIKKTNKDKYYFIHLFKFNKENEFKEMKKFLKNENDNLFNLLVINNYVNFYYDKINNIDNKINELNNLKKHYEKLKDNKLNEKNNLKNDLIKFIFIPEKN